MPCSHVRSCVCGLQESDAAWEAGERGCPSCGRVWPEKLRNKGATLVWDAALKRAVPRDVLQPRTRVVNVQYTPHFDVFIGRLSSVKNAIGVQPIEGNDGYFGNYVGEGLEHDNAILAFRGWFAEEILRNPEYKRRVETLRGKVLACWCAPRTCHGDVFVDYFDRIDIAESRK